jgi:hypothetical protein
MKTPIKRMPLDMRRRAPARRSGFVTRVTFFGHFLRAFRETQERRLILRSSEHRVLTLLATNFG